MLVLSRAIQTLDQYWTLPPVLHLLDTTHEYNTQHVKFMMPAQVHTGDLAYDGRVIIYIIKGGRDLASLGSN